MKLIEDARAWWRMWSVRYAAAVTVAATWLFNRIVENPGLILAAASFARGYELAIILAMIFLGFVVPTILRLLRQAKIEEKRDAGS